MGETKKQPYSLLERLMWLPMFTAPANKTFPKVLSIAAISTAFGVLLGGKPAILKSMLIGWVIGCWIASLTYRET